jgi:ligand-binding sensor domain-containing protein
MWKAMLVSLALLSSSSFWSVSSADTLFGSSGWQTWNIDSGKVNHAVSHPTRNERWLAKPDGVHIYDGATKSLIKILAVGTGKLPGPPNSLVFGDSGNVAIGTDSGLVAYNENQGSYKVYGKTSGLAGQNVKSLASYRQSQMPGMPKACPIICAGTDNGGSLATLSGAGLSSWSSGLAGKVIKQVVAVNVGGALYCITSNYQLYTTRPNTASWFDVTDTTVKYQSLLYDDWKNPPGQGEFRLWDGRKGNSSSVSYITVSGKKLPYKNSFSAGDNIQEMVMDTNRCLWIKSDSCLASIDLSQTFLGKDSLWNIYNGSDSAFDSMKITLQKFPRKNYSFLKDPCIGLNNAGHLMIADRGQIVEWTGLVVSVSRPTAVLKPSAKSSFVGIFSVDGKLISRKGIAQSALRPGMYLFISKTQGETNIKRRIIVSR